jgi:hypothetical protein
MKNDHPKVVENHNAVEHLEKSSPFIVAEITRWRNLLWEDYLDYQNEQKRRKKVIVP